MCFSRKKETCVCKFLILHYIGQDQEQGGHRLSVFGSNFGDVKTNKHGHR
jgi:hypothetical protein